MEENTLWMDKYKPRKLEDLTFHPNQTRLLQSLSENSEFPHLIFININLKIKYIILNIYAANDI